MAVEQLSYWIESSQTWTCPKTGTWKVICVGGGASGGFVSDMVYGANHIVLSPAQVTGATTSFGTYLSAAGAQKSFVSENGSVTSTTLAFCSGYNGYTGVANNLYGTIDISSGSNSFTYKGVGYGAGGGCGRDTLYGLTLSSGTSLNTVNPVSGLMGKIKSGFFNIDKGTAITCTIGAGGKASNLTSALVLNALQGGGAKPTAISADGLTIAKRKISDGENGVICLEYMD